MCYKTGWDKDYVGDNLTIEQIVFFYEEFRREELRQLKMQVIGNLHAMSAALTGDKDGRFKKFLNMLEDTPKNINTTIDEMKKSGLPIEDK
ncbi:MAG: hypothetical protein HY761_10065 [Candidatus Omnitrophica bacterium]|nr:hypothetical protein [Candidatus Omnitrophota bacterium]